MNIILDNLENKYKMKNVILTCLLTVTVISFSFAQLKVVAPNGDVGIGVTSPDEKLVVKGIAKITPQDGTNPNNGNPYPAVLQIGKGRTLGGNAFIDTYPTGSAWMGRLLSNADGVTTFSHKGSKQFQIRVFDQDAPIIFVTRGANRFTVTGEGNVGIGQASPTAKLHVNGSAVKTGGGMWGTASDKRLKDNVQDYPRGLAEVMKIRPVTFTYNGKAGIEDTDKVQTGIIAQEFQEIAPESVFKYNHTDITLLEDDKGFKKGASSEYLGIDPSQITYMLVNAVQEQQTIINELKNQIANLKTNSGISEAVNVNSVTLNGSEKASLGQNAPNPFSKNTTISYFVPTKSKEASMIFTDITGKEIKRLTVAHKGSGSLDVSIEDMPIGIYSYSLVVDGSTVASKKMVLSK